METPGQGKLPRKHPKSILCISLRDGNLLKKIANRREAYEVLGEYFGSKNYGAFASSLGDCFSGACRTAYGYKWKQDTEDEENKNDLSDDMPELTTEELLRHRVSRKGLSSYADEKEPAVAAAFVGDGMTTVLDTCSSGSTSAGRSIAYHPLCCVSLEDGSVLKFFNHCREVYEVLGKILAPGVTCRSFIVAVGQCIAGTSKSAYGFGWRLATDGEEKETERQLGVTATDDCDIENLLKHRKQTRVLPGCPRSKPLLCISLRDGKVLRKFSTRREAFEVLGVHLAASSYATFTSLVGQSILFEFKNAFGFGWRLPTDDDDGADIPEMSVEELLTHRFGRFVSAVTTWEVLSSSNVNNGRSSQGNATASAATASTYATLTATVTLLLLFLLLLAPLLLVLLRLLLLSLSMATMSLIMTAMGAGNGSEAYLLSVYR
jgi:hypothetical protein